MKRFFLMFGGRIVEETRIQKHFNLTKRGALAMCYAADREQAGKNFANRKAAKRTYYLQAKRNGSHVVRGASPWWSIWGPPSSVVGTCSAGSLAEAHSIFIGWFMI